MTVCRLSFKRIAEHPGFHLTVVALLCLAGFGRALSRNFVSEDFAILGHLAGQPLWATIGQHVTGPVLNLAGSSYYRPTGLVLLALEQLAWGATPTGYLWTHFSVHVLNGALLYHLVSRWVAGRELAWGAVLIFALYPLHPNTVVFIASSSTLFCVSFLLASLLLCERHRDDRRRSTLAAMALCFGLALGAYEQAVVLPVLVLGRDLLLGNRRQQPMRRGMFERHLTLGLVLALYLLARRAALGTLGLDMWSSHWLRGFEAMGLIRRSIENTVRLVVPSFGYETTGPVLLAAGTLLLVISLWSIAGLRQSRRSAGLWLFGLSWVIVSLVPLGSSSLLPATGRYCYLTSIGLGVTLVAAALILVEVLDAAGLRLRPVVARVLVATIVTAVGLVYLALLARNAGVYAEAGEVTRRIQGQLAALHNGGEQRVFVAGQPLFLRGRRGVPVAQVFHWGLADAVQPPFMATRLLVHPLPELTDTALRPLLEQPELGSVWRWSSTSSSLEEIHPPAPEVVQRVTTRGPQPAAQDPSLGYRAVPGAQHSLVLVTLGGSDIYPAENRVDSAGWSEARLPRQFLEWMDYLYGGQSYAWIEARQPDGKLRAVSRLHVIEPTG